MGSDHDDPLGVVQRRPYHAHGQAAARQGLVGDSSDCSGEYELDIRFPPPPPPRSPARAAAAAATASCSGGLGYNGGAQEIGRLLRRVEASTRAVSREKEGIVKVFISKYDTSNESAHLDVEACWLARVYA